MVKAYLRLFTAQGMFIDCPAIEVAAEKLVTEVIDVTNYQSGGVRVLRQVHRVKQRTPKEIFDEIRLMVLEGRFNHKSLREPMPTLVYVDIPAFKKHFVNETILVFHQQLFTDPSNRGALIAAIAEVRMRGESLDSHVAILGDDKFDDAVDKIDLTKLLAKPARRT